MSGGVDDDSDVGDRTGLQHRIHDTVRCYPTQRPLHRLLGVAGQSDAVRRRGSDDRRPVCPAADPARLRIRQDGYSPA